MANKKIIQGISVCMLLCAAIFIGCENEVPEEGNPWSNITSLAQVDGTWMGSDIQTTTNNGITMVTTFSITLAINASSETITAVATVRVVFSGAILSTDAWNEGKAAFLANPSFSGENTTVTVDDNAHSITISQTMEEPSADVSDMEGAQISQDEQKLRMPASEGVPEMILTKQ
jgi:hypothetical protein